MGRRVAGWAVLMAALAVPLRSAGQGKVADPVGKLVDKVFESEGGKTKFDYLLFLPAGYGKDEKKAWPLMLFLHGAGDKIARLKRSGLPRQVAGKKDFPCILVAPQNPARGWNARALGALLDHVEAKYKVDRDRVYVTGLSMGGFGTFALAAAYPDRFAAIAPICGGGNPATAKRLKDLPTWVFHGAKDDIVPARRSEVMVQAMKDAGAKELKFTLYPDVGHNAWTPAYRDPKLFEWLLAQRRPAKKKE